MVAVKRRAEGGVVRIEVIVAIDGFAKWVKSRILGHLQTNRLGQQRGFVSKPDLREIGMECFFPDQCYQWQMAED